MHKLYPLEANTGRKSEISSEELEDEDEFDYFAPEDNYDDENDEDVEREYCD